MHLEEQVISWLACQEVEAYLVGGCVRDRVLGRAIYDLDVAVAGDGLALARRLADRLGGAFYALDSERGTGRAILPRESGMGLVVDVARLRGSDLAEDLAGRDFAMNALALDVRAPDVVIDYHGGLADLGVGMIRAISEGAIRSDPVRALRAFRQAAQLGFAVDRETEDLIRRDGVMLAEVSAERICDELGKLLACASATPSLFHLDSLALLSVILPELEPLRSLAQPLPHRYDVLRHSLESVRALEYLLEGIGCTMQDRNAPGVRVAGGTLQLGGLLRFAGRLDQHLQSVMSNARPRLVTLKMAALLHDVGKPSAHTVEEDGRIRFLGHEGASSELTGEALERLRFSNIEVRLAESIVRHHMRPMHLASQEVVTSRAVYRFFRETRDAGIDVLFHSLADHLATYAFELEESGWHRLVDLVTRMLAAYWEDDAEGMKLPALVDGHDLLGDFGLQPGPQIARLLEAVREAQVVGEVHTRAEAMELIRSLLGG